MKPRDLFRWMTTVVAAAAIVPWTCASAVAASSVPGAGDASLPAASPQAIDRAAWGSRAGEIVFAGEEKMYSDDDGQPPEMDDQGPDNPPDPEDDDVYYAAADNGTVSGPGWRCGPGGRCLASG